MEVIEAIKTRRAIRGFKPDPVPKEVLTQILDIARFSPSGVNNQPWEFIVLTGDALEKAKRVNVEQFTSGAEASPTIPITKSLTGPYRERQIALAKEIFRIMGIAREDKKKRLEWEARGCRFHDALAAILICMDDEVFDNQWRLIDIGLVTQTIALLALEYGLGTCIQQRLVLYPEALKKAIGIPESKHLIIGLSIGYPDWDFPVNNIQREREPLDNLVTWKGFA